MKTGVLLSQAKNCQNLGERPGTDLLAPSEGAQLCQHLDLTCSFQNWEGIHFWCSNHSVCALCYGLASEYGEESSISRDNPEHLCSSGERPPGKRLPFETTIHIEEVPSSRGVFCVPVGWALSSPHCHLPPPPSSPTKAM